RRGLWPECEEVHHPMASLGHGLRSMLAALTIGTICATAAAAQTPPSQAEIAAYEGLHAATASGSVVEIDRLVKQGADLNARDGNGRTPMMVAAFRQDDAAVRALI